MSSNLSRAQLDSVLSGTALNLISLNWIARTVKAIKFHSLQAQLQLRRGLQTFANSQRFLNLSVTQRWPGQRWASFVALVADQMKTYFLSQFSQKKISENSTLNYNESLLQISWPCIFTGPNKKSLKTFANS